MGYAELLNALTLQPSSAVAEVGVPVTFTILPDISAAKVTEVQMVDVDLEFMAKGFAFPDADLDAWTPIGPLPIQDLVSSPPAVTPGVPGLLGRLRGKFPVAVPVDVAPRIEVAWAVTGERGRDLLARGDAVATAGAGGTSQTILFMPEVIELTSNEDPGTTPAQVTATVTMFAGGTSVGTRTLPAVTIQVRRLAMPTMFAMFQHKNYQGSMLVVVPEGTFVFQVGGVTAHVQALHARLQPFAGNPRLGFVAGTLATFHSALTTQSHIQFRKTSEIANLNDITFSSGIVNDTEAEDEISSLLLLGPPERAIDLFNDRSFKTGQGVMTLKTHGGLMAGVRDLHADFPPVEPLDASLLPRLQPPGSATFGDELSSLRFEPLLGA